MPSAEVPKYRVAFECLRPMTIGEFVWSHALLCEAPCAAFDVPELFSKTVSLPRYSHRSNVDENFVLIEREMFVQQDDAEEFLNLMLHEHQPDTRGQKSNVRRLQVDASIHNTLQGVVILNRVRKNGGIHIAEIVDHLNSKGDIEGLLVVEGRENWQTVGM